MNELRSAEYINIAVYVLLTLITCGIFNLYWNYRQMEHCNRLLNRHEFDFAMWILFSILTCGIYHIYYQYKMGRAIVEIYQMHNRPGFEALPVVSVLCVLFGFSIVTDCIHQNELNKLT